MPCGCRGTAMRTLASGRLLLIHCVTRTVPTGETTALMLVPNRGARIGGRAPRRRSPACSAGGSSDLSSSTSALPVSRPVATSAATAPTAHATFFERLRLPPHRCRGADLEELVVEIDRPLTVVVRLFVKLVVRRLLAGRLLARRLLARRLLARRLLARRLLARRLLARRLLARRLLARRLLARRLLARRLLARAASSRAASSRAASSRAASSRAPPPRAPPPRAPPPRAPPPGVAPRRPASCAGRSRRVLALARMLPQTPRVAPTRRVPHPRPVLLRSSSPCRSGRPAAPAWLSFGRLPRWEVRGGPSPSSLWPS